jgi:hypothetical protein
MLSFVCDIKYNSSNNQKNNYISGEKMEKKFPDDLEELIKNPKLLGNAEPEEWYDFLENNGYSPCPLGDGRLENIPFNQGGGFIIRWGGDRVLMYHPAKKSHHKGAYWKLSAGITGIRRFDLSGNQKKPGE